MDEYPTDEFAAGGPHDTRSPRPRTILIVVIILLAAAASAVWLIVGSTTAPSPNGSPAEAQAQPPAEQVRPIEERVQLTSLHRDALNEMLDAPATTIAWAVNIFGFRPPELAADEPWDPPSPERVLSLDDPSPVYTSFVRNVPVPDSEFFIDESIDLVLDDDGVTVIGLQYARFTDAPVENADVFLELPE